MPVRLVHWLMVLTVAAAWWTAETGRMDWHRYCGFTLLALLTFRIYWGFFGSSTARFARFVRGPRAIVSYLRGTWPQVPGHNPLGSLSVIALLAGMLTQAVLGLFTVDVDGIESGPLSTFVSFDAGRLAAGWHHRLFDMLLWLIGLHIAAVLFYVFIRKDNLIGAMLTGKKAYDSDQPQVTQASAVRFIVGVLLAGLLTWMVSRAFQFG
ncbi:MAG: cytochrome b/b6 domain-containing protein [Pseudomonadota bacterium]